MNEVLGTVSTDNEALISYCAPMKVKMPSKPRLLLVQTPQLLLEHFDYDIARSRGYYMFPPTGLQYLEEAIKDRDIELDIYDLNFQLLKNVNEDPSFRHENWPQLLAAKLEEWKPDIVGVSCLFDVGIKPMFQALKVIRDLTDCVIIGGGVVASYEWRNLVSDELCHFVIEGEGENKLNFLLDQLTSDKGHTPTPGIHFQPNDDIIESSGAPDIVDVQGDLISSYQYVPIEEYFKYGSLNPFSRMDHALNSPFAVVQFERGCRAACTFCAVRDFMGKGVRHRPISDVLAEMEYLIKERGVRHFELLDDDPTFFKNEFKDILRAIIAQKWDMRWSANNGVIAASIDEELLDLMQESGCIGFKVGIETGNEEMLRRVKKPGKHYKFIELSEKLVNYPNIIVGGNFIVGLPEETFGQMMDSFRFALEVKLDWAAISTFQLLRGAEAFSDSGEYFEHQMKTGGEAISNFMPARDAFKKGAKKNHLYRNTDIFKINAGEIPTAEQVKEIWFAFNLIANYVNSKNLKPGGNPQKFLSWVQTAQRAYPTNPYMMLFLSLAHRLLGEDEKATECHRLANEFVNNEYWQDRFKAFHLNGILQNMPNSISAVYDSLADVWTLQQESCHEWLALPRGQYPHSGHAA